MKPIGAVIYAPGPLLLGVFADRFGPKRVLIAGLLVQAFAIGTYLFVTGSANSMRCL
jgi:MFS family permease